MLHAQSHSRRKTKMAQIKETVVSVVLSTIVKTGATAPTLIDNQFLGQLETIVQELVGDGVVVEVIAEQE